MSNSDLGAMPEPHIEPGEPNPGGVDAVAESDGIEAQDGELAPRDLDPEHNPAVEDALPDEMKRGEDTSTEATKDAEDSTDVPAEEESPA